MNGDLTTSEVARGLAERIVSPPLTPDELEWLRGWVRNRLADYVDGNGDPDWARCEGLRSDRDQMVRWIAMDLDLDEDQDFDQVRELCEAAGWPKGPQPSAPLIRSLAISVIRGMVLWRRDVLRWGRLFALLVRLEKR